MSTAHSLTEQMLQLKRGTEEFTAARRVATLPDCGAALYEPAEHPKCAIAQMCKAMQARGERSVTCAVAAAVANVAAAITGGVGVAASAGASCSNGAGGDGAIGNSVLHGPPSVRDVLKAAFVPSARAEMLAAARAAHASRSSPHDHPDHHYHHHHHDAVSGVAKSDGEKVMGEKVPSSDALPPMSRDSSSTMGRAAASHPRRSSQKHNLFASMSDFGDRVLSHVFGAGPSPHQRRMQEQHHHTHSDHASRASLTSSPRSPNTRTAAPSAAVFDAPSSTTAMRGDDSSGHSSCGGSQGSGDEGGARRARPRKSRGTASAAPPLARASAANTIAPSLRSTAAASGAPRGSAADLSRSGATRTHFMPHATSMYDPLVAAATEAAAASERRREARQRERDRRANEFAADICIFENNEDTQRAYIEEVAESVFQALREEAANEFGKLRSAQWWDGRKETLTERMTKHVVETYFRRMHGYARQNFRFLFSATSEGVPKPWNHHQRGHPHHHHAHHEHHEHRRFHLRHDARGGIIASPEEIAVATRVARTCGAQLVVDMALTDDDESSMDFLVLPGQRISLANCPADKLYLYYAFMAFKSHKDAFSTPDSLAAFREAVRDVFLDPEGTGARRHLCTLHAAQMVGRAGACGLGAGGDVSIDELEARSLNDAPTRSALGRRLALLALRHAMDMISTSAYFPRLALDLYARVLSLESHLRCDDIEGAGVELMVGGATNLCAASHQNAGLGGCITAAARNRASREHDEMSFAVEGGGAGSGADASFGRALTPAPSMVFPTANADTASSANPVGVARSDGVSADGAGPQDASATAGALIARTLSVFRGADDAAVDAAGEPFSPSSAVASPTALTHSDSTSFDQFRVSTTAAFTASTAAQAPAGGKAAITPAPSHHHPHRARAASAAAPVDLSSSTISSRARSAHHRDSNRAALPEHMRLLIGDVLGKGATGCVYAAMCTDTSRMLALKEMRIRDVTRTNARSRGGHAATAAPAIASPAAPAATPNAVTPATAIAPAAIAPAAAAPAGATAPRDANPAFDVSDDEVPNVDTLGLTTGAFDLRTPETSASPTFGAPHAPPPPPVAPQPSAPAHHAGGCAAGLRPLSFHHSTEESLIPKVSGPTHTEVCVGADDVTYSPTMDGAATAASDSINQQPSPSSFAAPIETPQAHLQAPLALAALPKLPLEEEGMLTITQDSETTSETASSPRNDEPTSGSETDTEGPEGEPNQNRGHERGSTSADNTTSTALRTAATATSGASTAPSAATTGALMPTTPASIAPGAIASRALRNAGATATAITEEEQRVVDEINLLRRLRHENIVAYLGCKWDRLHGVVYIVMELCPHSLRDIRKSLKTMPLTLIAHYARGVLSGLRYLHDQHIVHRDIKAANILVTDQGVVKVSDFGVSVTVADDEEEAATGDAAGLGESENVGTGGQLRSANAIKRRTLCGTPCFIAPELFNGASCSESSDIWSFGCLMVELASGSSPWWNYPHHNGLWQIARRLRAGVAPSLPKTPAQAAALKLAASVTGVVDPRGTNNHNGDAVADLSASTAVIGGLSPVATNEFGQPHPALLDMGAPLTYVEGATEATPAFEDFVAQCLAFDTCRRPSAAALLAHPFLNPRG